MDYEGENGNENWDDQAVWATEDEYGMWNGGSQSEPPSKRSRNSQSGGDLISSNRAKAIGKMFYKTKLCCKFRAATCPYITNCNFAHSVEELRKPPPNWQDIVAAHEEDSSETREEFQIPILGVTDDGQRSYKGRHCKKFYTEEGCPYGDNCTFLHDEQSKARESVVISLGPGSGSGGGGYGNNANGSTLKPSNWKTRICNKWELTGYCPFGSKCHFAHGNAEVHNFGGTDSEVKDSTPDGKQGTGPAKTWVDTVVASENYHSGVPPQRLSNVTGHRPMQKWKGPDKISKIYGDWIDDL